MRIEASGQWQNCLLWVCLWYYSLGSWYMEIDKSYLICCCV